MAGNLVPTEGHDSLEPTGSNVPQPWTNLSPAPVADDDEGGPNWSRYVEAVKRYKWLILLVTLVGTGIGVIATRFVKPEYTAQATIWIESPPGENGPIRSAELLRSQSWVELLTTYTVLDSVIQKEKLYLQREPGDSALFRGFRLAEKFRPGAYTLERDDRAFTLKTKEGVVVQTGTLGDSVGSKIGFVWAPTPAEWDDRDEIAFTVLTPREASASIISALQADMAENGNFLRLIMTGTDPGRISATLNTLTEQFVSVAADLKKRKLVELARILDDQTETVGTQLREAEARLQGFKVQTITKPSEGTPIAAGIELTQPTVVSRFFNQKVESEELRLQRQQIMDVLERAQSGSIGLDAFQGIPVAQQSADLKAALTELATAEAELRALRYRYTDEAKQVKDVQERVQTLRSTTIPAAARRLAGQLAIRERELNQQIAGASRELQQIPSRTITEQRLTREVASIAAIYTDLQARLQAAKLAEASAIPDVRILDPAVAPTRPSSNSAPQIILAGFGASLLLAVGLALLLDRLDKRFRYPEQVTHELGLSILGAIPQIRRIKDGKEDVEEAAQVVEAFRTVRLNLAHSYGAAGPVMVTISSPGPGDGKSLVSSNLALSFAEAGYKTVLVDGDIRRGELHRMFGAERVPGLIDYLTRSAGLDEIMRPSTHKNLTVVPCGTRRHHGPELLGSGAMTELMAALKTRHQVIIVDSPPLGAGIDPFVLGTATGNILVVLRSGETDRQMAEAKLKLLDRLPVRVLGAVLNDIQASGVYQYYHYVYGYTADEEARVGSLPSRAGRS